MKSDPRESSKSAPATIADIRHLLGEVDDVQAMKILALAPTIEQVEQAAFWLEGEGNRLSREGHPLQAVVAAIVDLVAVDEEEGS